MFFDHLHLPHLLTLAFVAPAKLKTVLYRPDLVLGGFSAF